MQRDFQSVGAALRLARRAQGLTQAEVASRVGIKQSQISALEHGQADATSDERIRQLAQMLEVNLDTPDTPRAEARPRLAICTNSLCLSALPYSDGQRILIRPHFHALSVTAKPVHCPYCGQRLTACCPDCHRPIAAKGPFCQYCGEPFVDAPTPEDLARTAEQDAECEKFRAHRMEFLAELHLRERTDSR